MSAEIKRELLQEEILFKSGAFERVRRFWKGWHPELENAKLGMGWKGKETEQEVTIIKPSKTFKVNNEEGKTTTRTRKRNRESRIS